MEGTSSFFFFQLYTENFGCMNLISTETGYMDEKMHIINSLLK